MNELFPSVHRHHSLQSIAPELGAPSGFFRVHRRFLRVHRSHLIALAYAERLEREASRQWVVMATFPPSRIAIGRSRAAAVGERLGL